MRLAGTSGDHLILLLKAGSTWGRLLRTVPSWVLEVYDGNLTTCSSAWPPACSFLLVDAVFSVSSLVCFGCDTQILYRSEKRLKTAWEQTTRSRKQHKWEQRSCSCGVPRNRNICFPLRIFFLTFSLQPHLDWDDARHEQSTAVTSHFLVFLNAGSVWRRMWVLRNLFSAAPIYGWMQKLSVTAVQTPFYAWKHGILIRRWPQRGFSSDLWLLLTPMV